MCSTNIPREFDIKDFSKDQNYVIEASAGTGKTHTIVEMVKILLNEGVTLDKMVIVTYTEKAAGELKDRIRSALIELDVRDNPKNDVDNASIGTIHSFCQNIIKKYFISAGKPSCQKLIDESEIKNFLSRYIRKGDIYKEICDFKRTKTDESIENSLVKKIAAYIDKFYLRQNGEIDTTVISFNDEILEKETFSKAKSLEIYKQADIQDAIEILLNSTENTVREFASYMKNNQSIDYSDFRDSNNKAIRKNYFKTNQEQQAYETLQKAKGSLSSYNSNSGQSKITSEITKKYLQTIYIAWQKEKENLCEQTYNDMIRDVREEILKPDSQLLERIKNEYTYAIIDEFQDTNQKQWDIFKTAFLCEGHNIIVVGDPKQSIYSFQGADVTVYGKAKNEIVDNGGFLRILKKNWRATKGIIDSANAFFDKTNNPSALPDSIAFENSDVGNSKFKAEYKGKEIKAYWITEKGVTPGEYARIVSNRIVDFCTTNENNETKLQIWDKDGIKRDVSFKDFAILARTRSEMEPIKKAFEKCGIPYIQYKDKKLFSGKECADWIAVLEAINVPDFTGYNRVHFRKAMLTCFFGYSLNDIDSSYFDKDSAKEIGFFEDFRNLAKDKNWTQLIEKIIITTDIAGKLQLLGNIKAFGSYMQIADYCADYLSRTNNLEMLIRNLRKQCAGNNDEDADENDGTIAKSTDADCVQIMTIHASKGLEFPIVISVAGFKGKNNAVVNAYTYHDTNGNNYLTFSSNSISNQEEVEELQRIYYVAYTRVKYLLMLPCYPRKKNDPYHFIKDSIDAYKHQNSNDYEPLPMNNDNRTLEDLKDDVKKIYSRNKNSSSICETDLNERESEIKEFGESFHSHTSNKHAYSSISKGKGKKETKGNNEGDKIINGQYKRNTEDDGEFVGLSDYDTSAKTIPCNYDESITTIELSPNFIAGTGLGNALHKVFELIDYTKDNNDIDELIKKCFADEKIRCKDEWVVDVKNMVQNVLNATLPEIQGNEYHNNQFSLKDIDFAHRKNEVEFNFNIFNEKIKNHFSHYMNGFVDLIFERNGYYSVLDWKSNRLNDTFDNYYNKNDSVKKHVDELYSIQRVLYSYCLIKWLKQFYPNDDEQKIFEEHFGGVYYVFLRGCNAGCGNGIYAQTWKSFDDLKKEYEKIINERVY